MIDKRINLRKNIFSTSFEESKIHALHENKINCIHSDIVNSYHISEVLRY